MSVLFEQQGNGGWITLNRPQALNALNTEMIIALDDQLKAWESDESIDYVVIQGLGRGFCAGGDLRAIYQATTPEQVQLAYQFFQLEYALNLYIHNYSKPYIALLHGITMGGGMGISIHGSHRVVTENTIMAMPETAIGLFPDVGAAWYLNRCPGKSGLYMALTSHRINHVDARYLGLATHYVHSTQLPELIENIENLSPYQLMPEGPSFMRDHQAQIDKYFNQSCLEDIFRALAQSDHDFVRTTLQVLQSRSPHSLRATFDYMKKAETMTIEQVMAHDWQLASGWANVPDFREGIRAAVIDKDQKPQWLSKPIAY